MLSRALACSAAVLLVALGTPALGAPAGIKSPNLSWLGTIPEPDGVGMTFVGEHVYISTLRGLSVYDVSNPRAPVKTGELDLPMFQNEDVSTNGEILLISRDASLGLSRLYVVDIRDPEHPTLLSSLDTSDYAFPGDAIGHTASCIDSCRYAWLAGRSDGIDVVDLRDPRNPRFANPRTVSTPFAACARPERRADCVFTHDVQVDANGLAWLAGGGGTVAFDVSNPVEPRQVMRTDARARSRIFGSERSGKESPGSALNDFIHHNSLRRGHTVFITEEDFHAGCIGAGSLQTWRIGDDGILRPMDSWAVERDPERKNYCSAHYFDERDGLLVQGWYEAGVRFVDVSDPRNLRQAAYWIPRGGDVASAYWAPTDPSGSIVYAIDEQRGIDILRIDRAARPSRARPPRQRRGSGLWAQPDVGVQLDNAIARARPGTTIRYRAGFANTTARRSPAGSAVVELGQGLSFSSGATSATVRVPPLGKDGVVTRDFRVRVARNAPPWVEASIAMLLDDADPANDYKVDRDPTFKTGPNARPSRVSFQRLCRVRP